MSWGGGNYGGTGRTYFTRHVQSSPSGTHAGESGRLLVSATKACKMPKEKTVLRPHSHQLRVDLDLIAPQYRYDPMWREIKAGDLPHSVHSARRGYYAPGIGPRRLRRRACLREGTNGTNVAGVHIPDCVRRSSRQEATWRTEDSTRSVIDEQGGGRLAECHRRRLKNREAPRARQGRRNPCCSAWKSAGKCRNLTMEKARREQQDHALRQNAVQRIVVSMAQEGGSRGSQNSRK